MKKVLVLIVILLAISSRAYGHKPKEFDIEAYILVLIESGHVSYKIALANANALRMALHSNKYGIDHWHKDITKKKEA